MRRLIVPLLLLPGRARGALAQPVALFGGPAFPVDADDPGPNAAVTNPAPTLGAHLSTPANVLDDVSNDPTTVLPR